MLKLTIKSQVRGTLFAASLLLLSASGAHAGGDVGNGGNTVTCEGAPTVILDYFQAALPTEALPNGPALIDVDGAKPGEVMSWFTDRFSPYIKFQFKEALAKIGPITNWKRSDLRDLNDAAAAFNLPKGCTMDQVAIRQGETVFVDPTELAKLSPGQRDILLAHEALYYLAEQSGFRTSAEVRVVVGELLKQSVAYTVSALERAVKAMKRFNYVNHGLRGVHFGTGDGAYVRFDSVDQFGFHAELVGQTQIKGLPSLLPVWASCTWIDNYGDKEEKFLQRDGFHSNCSNSDSSVQKQIEIEIYFSDSGQAMKIYSRDHSKKASEQLKFVAELHRL